MPLTPKRPGRSSRSLGLRQERRIPLRSPERLGTAPAWRRFFSRRTFTWRRIGIGTAAFAGVLFLGGAGTFAYYSRQLPNPKELTARPVTQSTKILDRNGHLIYSFHGEEDRTVVKSDEISDFSKKATVAVEDANFYSHPGFDAKGIARAMFCRVWPRCGRYAGGGSTITQQYVRNAELTGFEQTADRKVRELIISLEVEQVYGKDEILTGYLNTIPYGSNAYGIEAAARTYFSKPAKTLSLAEAATLAAIPQRPTYYSPYGNHLDGLFARKDYVLDRMVTTGSITKAEAEAAKSAAPNVGEPQFRVRTDLTAPHWVFFIRDELVKTLDADPALAERKLDSAGYAVTTSLDLPTQKLAEGVVAELGPALVKRYQASNAALSAVDPANGEVLAMVGSISYSGSTAGNVNYAAANLQPGSSYKPFVYATAFGPENSSSPAGITYDLPTDFGGGYRPNNYNGSFRGPVTNREALAQSLNVPAVKNLALAGLENSIKTAQRLGITTLNPKGEYGLSLVLGSGEVRGVDMANAYGAFANGGTGHKLKPILKIERDGKVVKDFTSDGSEAVKPEVAYEINSILSDNAARAPVFGSKNSLTLPDRPVAAKTGTTQNNRDAWAVGYTPQISVAVWVGNNLPGKTMTKGADGSYVAAPMWNRFMREYLTGKPVAEFGRPAGIADGTVDKLSGKLPTDQSPAGQNVTDIFAPWQLPSAPDDVHVKVKVSKITGKLATELTPADDIEERSYFTVHSERPADPNWEGPVQDWARANGGGTLPPTEKDDLHTAGNLPTLSILGPKDGSTVNGPFTVQAQPGGQQPITKVALIFNGTEVASAVTGPWNLNYDSRALTAGSNALQVVATNSAGLSKAVPLNLVSSGPSAIVPGTPSNVSSVQVRSGSLSRNQQARVEWNDPNEASLVSVNVQRGGGATTTVAKGKQQFDAGILPPGTYTFTLKSVGADGSQSPGVTAQARVEP